MVISRALALVGDAELSRFAIDDHPPWFHKEGHLVPVAAPRFAIGERFVGKRCEAKSRVADAEPSALVGQDIGRNLDEFGVSMPPLRLQGRDSVLPALLEDEAGNL